VRPTHLVLDLWLVLNSDVEEVIKDGRHISLDIDFLI
jgi:hypothetical protein